MHSGSQALSVAEKWMQLARLTQGFASLFHSVLALQAMAK
jgi:hypothetical protein